ncbi:MAG: adenosine deaminase [Anaerolineales bacterium]|nr:adenosine deaminase [Anaerolineales bacterium]
MIHSDLPLIDLHRHLDGSVRLETILDLGRQHGIPLPAWDAEGIRREVQITENQPGVMAFLEKFRWMTAVMVNTEACYRIAYENVEDAAKEGIDYLELRFSPAFMSKGHGLNPADVVEAVAAGVKAAQHDSGVGVNLIGIISRTYGVEEGWKEFQALFTHRDSITALDLAGDEIKYPAEMFSEHFKKARDTGWYITVHAGESAGPESIWQALRDLKANRIGHGIHALEDPALVDVLREQRIGIETNLTSNVQTSSVADYASHPLRIFLEKGLMATINTDDPGISGIDLRYEYEVAAPKAGITREQTRILQQNALAVAFLSETEKEALFMKKGNTAAS